MLHKNNILFFINSCTYSYLNEVDLSVVEKEMQTSGRGGVEPSKMLESCSFTIWRRVSWTSLESPDEMTWREPRKIIFSQTIDLYEDSVAFCGDPSNLEGKYRANNISSYLPCVSE